MAEKDHEFPWIETTGTVLDDSDKLNCDWFDEEHGGVAFWMDVAVADGMIERVPDGDQSAYSSPGDDWPDVIGESK